MSVSTYLTVMGLTFLISIVFVIYGTCVSEYVTTNTIDIENAPTVDTVEVVHGHWIHDEEYDICSICNNPVIMNRLSPDKWCKNCGAKMDG